MHCYRYYGLTVTADLPLPELNIFTSVQEDTFDVSIRRGIVSEHGLPNSTKLSPFLQATKLKLWLHVPGIAHFLIQNGNEIIYDPIANIDEDSIRIFILGSCTGALLHQRGFLVLHGNAFEVNGGCVICAGNSGAGKSTLAAAMMQRGHRVIADDVCPINDEGRVIPGMPRIKLWKDSADELNIDTRSLTRIRPALEKFNYPLNGAFCENDLPIKAIYILHRHNEQNFKLQTLKGIHKYRSLKNNSYRLKYVRGMNLETQHFKLSSQLANQIHICQLERPKFGFKITELTDLLLNDLALQGLYQP